jgi:hypothetical protein
MAAASFFVFGEKPFDCVQGDKKTKKIERTAGRRQNGLN